MSKTINTHVYTLKGMQEQSASFGALVSSVPYEARMQSIQTRQNGESGVRTSRSVIASIADAEGVQHPVVCSVSFFLPAALPVASLDAPFAELLEWEKEAGFLTAVKNQAVE